LDVNFSLLPHWARVAFAARCARLTIHLFDKHWPDAHPKYHQPVHRAIAVAESAAATKTIDPSARELGMNALIAAGRAVAPYLSSTYSPGDEDGPSPANQDSAVLASFCAKVAEHAVKASAATSQDSVELAQDAFRFAMDALIAARLAKRMQRIEAEFEGLYRLARNEKWNDMTPVPSDIFKSLPRQEPESRPWWKFW
jgi:hypothetical protein